MRRNRSITELAAILGAAHDVVESSADDDIGMENMGAVYAAEESILATPFTQDEAIDANHQILHQYGDPDWDDEFYTKLGRKILVALALGKIAVAA
jgi:hypothetical protein